MVRFSDDGAAPLAPVIPMFGGVPRDGYDACGAIEREIAERNLTKRLRMRQLSVGEARAVVAERDLDSDAVEAVLERYRRLGYLDDARLAEQLIHSGAVRKGQGRRVLAQTLAQRGIPRDVADAALAGLPDDDAERALRYARGKAAGMTGIDRETALRRLAGQLARRGYPSAVALSAAGLALEEVRGERRFVHFE
ncbi:MAG: regulatory protein RecX [Microbacterium sp.]